MSGSQANQIHNERTKLLAIAFNNLGVGAIIAGIVAPAVNGTLADVGHIAAWTVVGAECIIVAQLILGRLR